MIDHLYVYALEQIEEGRGQGPARQHSLPDFPNSIRIEIKFTVRGTASTNWMTCYPLTSPHFFCRNDVETLCVIALYTN